MDIFLIVNTRSRPHLSPWFSAASAAPVAHKNHFCRLYKNNNSSKCKVKFRQASNHCRSVFEAAKLGYANKTKESVTSQKLGSHEFSGNLALMNC